MKHLLLVSALALPLAAQTNEVPRHLFGSAPLTTPSALPAGEIALSYVRSLAAELGLTREDLDAIYVAREYRTAHNGVTHLLLRQRFQGLDVDNAEWTVNIDGDGQVINAGGDLVHAPAAGFKPPEAVSALAAVRAAVAQVNPTLAERYSPFQIAQNGAKLKFHRGEFADDIDASPVWHAVRGTARPAWKFYVADAGGSRSYAVIVDNASQRVLAKRDLTLRQSPRGLVFLDSPQPNPKPGSIQTAPPPLVNRTMLSFTGDPVASPKGWVDGNETAGNNVIAGTNPLGIGCLFANTCLVRPNTVSAGNRDFTFPLQLGDGAPAVTNFSDAATVNLFYWVNRAHDFFYSLGFDESAGNFQRDNFNRGGVPGDPIYAYSQYGTAAPQFVDLDRASFVQFRDEDGSQALMAIGLELSPAGLLYDNDFDASTILHEYSHGVSQRLVRQLNATFQGGAMGEGWGDFFALDFLTPDGAPLDAAYPFGEYPDQTFGSGIRTHPYSTNTDVNPLTFADLARVDRANGPEVHADGEIWAATLWEARAALIRQLGENEGRRRLRLLVIDAMKLAPPAPSMVDMRDAILIADRVNFKGASQDQLWSAFAKRGLGATAQSRPGAVHISASFDKPSSTGSLRFYETDYVIGEDIRLVLQDSDLDVPSVRIQLTSGSGDVENLLLVRRGTIYVGDIPSNYAPVAKGDGLLELIPGDFITAYYVDANAGSGPKLTQISAPAAPDYTYFLRNPSFRFTQETRLNLRRTAARLIELPFRFRFFGKDYSYVWVHNYGLLTFDLPDYSPCSDVGSLQMLKGIAPMWMFLTTAGGVQANEDVYVSATPDTVTFRWAAETVADVPTAPPEPVNFSATLYRDGRIQFNYGSGNHNLSSGSQLFGCPVGTPTIGISNGHEDFVQLAFTHDSKGALENAPTVIFDPPYNFSSLPEGKLESPDPGAEFTGVLSGRGVLFDANTEGGIRRVDLLIDGVATDSSDSGILLGVSRPDFCGQQRVPGCPMVGFEIATPMQLAGINEGSHTMQLRATNTRGGFTDLPAQPLPFVVKKGAGDAASGAIETPADGARVSGNVTVRGWAAVNDRRVLVAEILVDGVNLGRATYGQVRNDICNPLSPRPPDCPRVGFSFTLDTRTGVIAIPNGTHTIAARIIDDGLRLFTLPGVTITVNNATPASEPQIVLTSPKVNERLAGTVHISGYAWAANAKVARVQIFIDGVIPVDARYGGARPEACAQLPDVAACPAIGFDLDYDTTKLANGPHTIFVLAVDDRGGVGLLPANSLYGLNVVVQN